MHDTFLNENIYETVTEICKENGIVKINSITVSVHPLSHVCNSSLRELFYDRGSSLIGTETIIIVQKDLPEPLMAEIREIDGTSTYDCPT